MSWLLEGAARVFRRHGFGATTKRIAAEAGVGIGTLYEYFPNKQALLRALAERHLETAEQGIEDALATPADTLMYLRSLQSAIVASHRYPSQALELVSALDVRDGLRARAEMLRARVLQSLRERAAASSPREAEARARAVFGVIGELSSKAVYEASSPADHAAIARQFLRMAMAVLESAPEVDEPEL